jgi:hypothetical protein
MELSDFGRGRRAMVLPLTAVPILAGIAGAGWASTRPAEYRYSVDVQIPAPSGQSGAAALDQNVSTYRGLVGSTQVVGAVSRQTGVRAGEVRDELSTGRPQVGGQGGGLVRVVYTGPNRSAGPAITRAAALAAADELLRPSWNSARETLGGSQASAQNARQALAGAAKKYGGLPIEEYRALQNQIARLQTDGDASGGRPVAGADSAIKAGRKRLAALTPRVIEVQALQDQLGQADRKLADAQQGLRDVQGRLASAKGSVTPGSPAAVPIARGPVILRTAGVSAGVGVFLAVAVLVLTEMLRRRPEPITVIPERITRPVERT